MIWEHLAPRRTKTITDFGWWMALIGSGLVMGAASVLAAFSFVVILRWIAS